MKKVGRTRWARRCFEINFEIYQNARNLGVLDYPDYADPVKILTQRFPHPLDGIGLSGPLFSAGLLDPLHLQVILFDYGNLDRTRSDGKVE